HTSCRRWIATFSPSAPPSRSRRPYGCSMRSREMRTRAYPNRARRRSSRLLLISSGVAAMALGSTAALAYRPFVGTDAAVADVNEVEIELQPAGTLRQDQQTNLVAPDLVYNYGFAKDLEFVFEGTRQRPLGTTDEPAT